MRHEDLRKDITNVLNKYKSSIASYDIEEVSHTPHSEQVSTCTDLITEAIAKLQEALTLCCPCNNRCQGTITSVLPVSEITFLKQKFTGRSAIIGTIQSGCNEDKNALIFSFITENGFPFALFSTDVQFIDCSDSPSMITIKGKAIFQIDLTTIEVTDFLFSFGNNPLGDCSFTLQVNTENGITPFFTTTGTVPCENINITTC